MGILYDDVVMIKHSEQEGEPSVITVNCPDKTGLGCDICRIILFFGLTVVRIGMRFSLKARPYDFMNAIFGLFVLSEYIFVHRFMILNTALL